MTGRPPICGININLPSDHRVLHWDWNAADLTAASFCCAGLPGAGKPLPECDR